MKMECLLLSADGDISLYEISRELFDRIDECVEEFDKWRRKRVIRCYDETLFIRYLKRRYGEQTIHFCKIVGECCGKTDQITGLIEDDLPEEFRDTKWINF